MVKKRIASFLVLLLLAMLLILPVHAEGTMLSICTPETLPEVGKTFTVMVEINGNPGLCAAQSFDHSIVSCERASVGEVLKDTLSVINAEAQEGAIVAAVSTTPLSSDGTIGEFTFKVIGEGTTVFALADTVFTGADNQPVEASAYAVSVGMAKPDEKTESEGENEQDELETTGGTTSQTFSDVPASFWGYEYIETAAAKRIIKGMADGTFAPNRDMTRAEFVTMLYRMAGEPAVTDDAPFTDVPAGVWYHDAVSWAAEMNIVKGISNITFVPNGKVTRQEAMTILFRYSGGASGMEMMLTSVYDNQFSDSGTIASWAKSAVYWAVYNGIVDGTTDTTISPLDMATRAQIAAILVRYSE